MLKKRYNILHYYIRYNMLYYILYREIFYDIYALYIPIYLCYI